MTSSSSALHQFAILVTLSLLLLVLLLEIFQQQQQQQTVGTYMKDDGQDGQDGEKQVVVTVSTESSLSTISRLLETNQQDDLLFEGDIMPTWESISAIYGEETAIKLGLTPPPPAAPQDINNNIQHGSGSQSSIRFWNNAWNKRHHKYVIWIYIHSGDYNSSQKKTIRVALRKLANQSGTFIFKFPTTRPGNNRAYLSIESKGGCWSYIGRTSYSTQSGGQKISLAPGCLSTGTIQHEMMHALGFWHEQSRPDRDNYVSINLNNVQSGYEGNFHKTTSINSLGVGYDYSSVMHYGTHYFSKNGNPTIVPKNGNTIGQRDKASWKDIVQIRLMYQCQKTSTGQPRSRHVSIYNNLVKRCNTGACKCGKNWYGCDSDAECKGKLVCKSKRCKPP